MADMIDEPAARSRFTAITLSEPVKRGATAIAELTLRKPRAGELRGLTLQDVISTDITALLKLIPRISDPPLTQDEADSLEPEDLSEIGGAIRGFFMTTAERQVIEQMIAEHRPTT